VAHNSGACEAGGPGKLEVPHSFAPIVNEWGHEYQRSVCRAQMLKSC
jgi:hypothetical protein